MTLLGLDEIFFAEAWRRRPVVLRGAARELIAEAPDASTLAELRERPELHCITDDERVWFYQGLVDETPLIARLTAAARELFEWEDVTCDIVHTEGAGSIGCHFDQDDNFSVQLVGAKHWRFSPPDTLPADLVRRRMLKEPDVGFAELGPEVTELFVEAGDVLYIPRSWIHWGQAKGPSTSISVVVDSRTFHLDFAASVVDALRQLPGWSRSISVGPGSSARRSAALDELVGETFSPMAAHEVRPYISEHQALPSLTVDMDRVRAFIANAPPAPRAGFVVPAEGVDTHGVLRALLARRTLRRLLRAIAQRWASTQGLRDRLLYQQCVEVLLARSDPELERLCSEPELVSIAAIAKDGEVRHEDPLAGELARALVPEFEAAGADSAVFSLLPDLDGAFTLRRAGVRVVPQSWRDELVVRVVGGAWQVFVEGRFRPPEDAPGLELESLPRLLGEGPHLSPAPTAWVARNVRDQEIAAADSRAFVEFCDAMRSGAETLAAVWPAAWREVAEGVRWLLPLPDRGPAAHNYSVHAFRGMIVSSPRRDHRAAQTLVHEGGHNRLSTILDLFELCVDPSQVVVSPVVNAARPMSFVFHGCFAFAQDVALTRRLLARAHGGPRASMERYLDEVRHKAGAALDLIEREAETTAIGATLLREIAEVVGR